MSTFWYRFALGGMALLVGAGVQACDPCAGIAGCNGDPHAAVTGRILDESNGQPVAGAAIDYVRTGGASLDRDSARTFTDRDGVFSLEMAARASGVTHGEIVVRPPSADAYRVLGVDLETTSRRGEARAFRPWSTVPALRDIAVIALRGLPAQTAVEVPIEFRRTGGVQVQGMPDGVFRSTTNADGWAPLFGLQVQPLAVGDVVGDLTVLFPDPIGPKIRRNVHVAASALFRKPLELQFLNVGPNFEHHILLFRRGRLGETVPGIEVHFERTGGIRMTTPAWTAVPDFGGHVAFPGSALDSGTLTGNLRVVPPSPWKAFTRPISLDTYEEDGFRMSLTVDVGPGIGGYLRLHANGVPVSGVEVEVQRTGGVALSPATFKAVTNDTGYVYLTSASDIEGEAVADVIVRPKPPYGQFVVRGVRFPAFDGDAPAAPTIIGSWNVASPPASAGRAP